MSVSIAFSKSSFEITAPEPARFFTSSFEPIIVTDSTSMLVSAFAVKVINIDVKTNAATKIKGDISSATFL